MRKVNTAGPIFFSSNRQIAKSICKLNWTYIRSDKRWTVNDIRSSTRNWINWIYIWIKRVTANDQQQTRSIRGPTDWQLMKLQLIEWMNENQRWVIITIELKQILHERLWNLVVECQPKRSVKEVTSTSNATSVLIQTSIDSSGYTM